MRRAIALIILLFTVNNYAQNLIEYKFSGSIFSINIPEGFDEYEASGQKYARSIIGDNVVLVSKSIEKNTVTIQNESNLIEYYNGIKRGISKSIVEDYLENNIIEVNGLKLLKLKYKMLIENNLKIFDTTIISLNDYTYSVMFISSPEEDFNFKQKRDEILATLKFN
jgi:hypothetical protein